MDPKPPVRSPLHDVSFSAPPQAPQTSPMDVAALQKAAQQAETAQRREADVAPLPDVPPPDVTPEEVSEIYQLQHLLQRNQLYSDLANEQLERERRAIQRNKSVLERAQQSRPLKLRDLLFHGHLSLQLEIDEDYVVQFQTYPVALDLLIDDMSHEVAKEYTTQSRALTPNEAAFNRLSIIRILTLVAGVGSLADKPMYADQLRTLAAPSKREEAQKVLRTGMEAFMQYPGVLLEDLHALQALFTVQVRKTLQDAGYVANQQGKS